MYKGLVLLVVLAFVMTILLVGGVFMSGQTFGQRCAKQHTTQVDIDKCVQDLSKGRK